MITILYFKADKLWGEQFFDNAFSSLPKNEQIKIIQYKDKKERQLRITGKLMLQQLLYDFDMATEYCLNDIKYDVLNKPYLNESFYFSIAHSENFVICAAAVKNSIGIDVEKIKPINVLLLKDILTSEEWLTIELKNYDLNYFYYLWTRKEAVLKAIGKGIFEEMGKVDVLKDKVMYEAQSYYVNDISINADYKIAIASNRKETFEVREFVV